MSKIYRDQVGVEITLDSEIDLTGADLLEILGQKPSGEEFVWPATASGTGLKYTTVAGDLNEAGNYDLQNHVHFPDGRDGLGETFQLFVYTPYN